MLNSIALERCWWKREEEAERMMWKIISIEHVDHDKRFVKATRTFIHTKFQFIRKQGVTRTLCEWKACMPSIHILFCVDTMKTHIGIEHIQTFIQFNTRTKRRRRRRQLQNREQKSRPFFIWLQKHGQRFFPYSAKTSKHKSVAHIHARASHVRSNT